MRIHLVYQWYTPAMVRRLLRPLEILEEAGRIELSCYSASGYRNVLVSGADVIIFSNIVCRTATVTAEEARLKGVRMIYDESLESGSDGPSHGFIRDYYHDVRARNVRDRLLRTVDAVISPETTIVERHPHIRGRCHVREKISPDWLYDTLKAVSPVRARDGGLSKRILFITPTLMWPYQQIADLMAEELMRMGHDLHLFTVNPPGFLYQTLCKPGLFEERLVRRIVDYSEDAYKIPLLIDRTEPDVVLTIQGYVIPRQILKEIKKRGVPSAVWFMKEPYDTMRSCSYGRYFTHVFLQDRASLMYHRRYGNPNSFYLPHGSAPVIEDAPPNGDDRYRYGLSLTGTPTEDRVRLVRGLREAGMEVTVAGPGWEGVEEVNVRRIRSHRDRCDHFRSSLVNINLHGTERSSYNPWQLKAYSPNLETFDISASAAFQLVDDRREGVKECFEPGKEIVQFSDVSDCIEKARYYLENVEEVKAIASSAHERACREHGYRHRIEFILKTVEDIGPEPEGRCHYRMGYVQFSSEVPESVDLLPDSATLTAVSEDSSRLYIENKMRVIQCRREEGFSSALNGAVLNTPSDHIAVGPSGLWHRHSEITSLVDGFLEDLQLGALLLRDPEGGEITGIVMPARVLMDAGSFRYGNAERSLLDIRYRLEEAGLVVKETPFASSPLAGSIFSLPATEAEEKEFLREWTGTPAERLTASRLLGLVLDNPERLDEGEATRSIQKTVEVCPGFLKGREYLARLYLKQGKASRAIGHLEFIWESNPGDGQTGLLLSLALIMKKEFHRASSILERILDTDLEPSLKASALYQKGLLLKGDNDVDRAMECFNLALGTDPTHLNAMRELAMICIELGRPEEALELMKARLSFLVSEETLNDVGAAYWMRGEKEEAYQYFLKALESDPASKSAVVNAVTAAVELGRDPEEVRDLLVGYLNHHPDDLEAWRLLEGMR